MNGVGVPPEKLSDLIELAVADARTLDRDTYIPDCWAWHAPGRNNKCRVCLAGAVIAGTLRVKPKTEVVRGTEEYTLTTDDGETPVEDKVWSTALYAIDNARGGDWSKALGALDIQVDEATSRKLDKVRGPEEPHFHTWTELGDHLDSMTECAQELRGLGL